MIASNWKPDNWSNLKLYQKIKIYGNHLNQSFAIYVDKLLAKNLVINRLQSCHNQIKIPKVIRILDSPQDFTQSDIHPQHLLKPTHASGWILNLGQITNLDRIKRQLTLWNKTYSIHEKQYLHVKPRFFIEEKIICQYRGLTHEADDIKVYCFHGRPQLIFVEISRGHRYYHNLYDVNWNLLSPSQFTRVKPPCLDDILHWSSLLSESFEFVRMDYYIGVDGVYFSEYTFTPHGGQPTFSETIETQAGQLWT